MPTHTLQRMVTNEILILNEKHNVVMPDEDLMEVATDILDLCRYYADGIEYDPEL